MTDDLRRAFLDLLAVATEEERALRQEVAILRGQLGEARATIGILTREIRRDAPPTVTVTPAITVQMPELPPAALPTRQWRQCACGAGIFKRFAKHCDDCRHRLSRERGKALGRQRYGEDH